MFMVTRFVRTALCHHTAARLAPGLLLAPAMSEHQFADSRTLNTPFSQQLASHSGDGALAWLTCVLATQAPALRSSNAI